MKKYYFLSVFIGCLFFVFSTSADTYIVTKTADTLDGACNDDCSLREAVSAANAHDGDDTITLAAGEYILSRAGMEDNNNNTGDLDVADLNNSLTINGVGRNSTIINANDIDNVFEIVEATAILNLYSLKVYNGTNISMPIAMPGGGIINYGTLNIDHCLIDGNSCMMHAGGIYNIGTLSVSHSIFSNNNASSGSGVYNYNSSLATINNSLFVNNTSAYGSFSNFGSADIINTTITASTGTNGGAVYIGNAAIHTLIINSTLANNSATLGESLYVDTASVTIKNSILNHTTNNNCTTINGGAIVSSGYNIDSGTSCGFNATGDQQSTDPLLNSLADNGGNINTMSLKISPTVSPAINKILPASCTGHNDEPLTADQRGSEYGRTGYCDIGAYEYQDTTAPVITITNDTSEHNTVECKATYTDLGATAADDIDGSRTISAINSVDTNILNIYSVVYSASDLSNNTGTAARTVTVQDTTKPAITLIGDSTLNIYQYTTYTDPGVTAADACYGDLTTNIQTVSTVDTNTVGTYTVTYSVSDASNNIADTATRTINVLEKIVSSVAEPDNTQITVTYNDGTTQTFVLSVSVAAVSTDNKRVIVLNKTGKKLKVLDAFTGETLALKTINKKKQTAPKLKVFNYKSDAKDEIVVASKQGKTLRTTALSLTSADNLKNKNTKTKDNISAKTIKITRKNSTLTIKHKTTILAKYKITAKAKLKKI